MKKKISYPFKFKAAVLFENFKKLQIKQITFNGPLLRGQILVKILYSGICGKQIDEIDKVGGKDEYLPHLLGHEGSGIVQDIGPGVKKFKPGDKVVLHWIKNKGIQSDTPKYHCNNKVINAGWITTFNEYSVVSENRLTKVNIKYPLDKMCLYGCCILTSFGLIKNVIKKVNYKSKLLIIGSGGIGQLIILAAKNYFKNIEIHVIDKKQSVLDKAKLLGANQVYKINELNKKVVKDKFNNCIVTTGNIDSISLGIESIVEGGTCYLVGVPPKNKSVKFNGWSVMHNRTIKGNLGGNSNPKVDIKQIMDLDKSTNLNLNKIISKKFRFVEINEAIKYFRSSKNNGRVILKF